MTNRAENSGVRLTRADAAIAKGMIARGDRHHDIAAWFGVNQGRIAEINRGLLHAEVEVALSTSLPPVGPYSSGRSAHRAIAALEEAKLALNMALQSMEAALSEIASNATGQ